MEEPLRFQHFEVYQESNGHPHILGRGGMGITYKAFDVNLGRDVALKVISPQLIEGKEARARFLREARTAASFRHPHVASVHHLGESFGDYFYAMEFVDGETLDTYRQRVKSIPATTALDILEQVADALGAASQLGLVHRDIKPSNVMVYTDSNGRLSVKLIDFGLAKSFQDRGVDATATLTLGGFVGTPAYASPEQLENLPLDASTDIYSLGITLYFMLCGKPPFRGSIASVISQQLTNPLPTAELADQPPAIVQLLSDMAAKAKENRPKDGLELKSRIDQCRETMRDWQEAAEPNPHWLLPYISKKLDPSKSTRRGRTIDAITPEGKPVEVLVIRPNWTLGLAEIENVWQSLDKNCQVFKTIFSLETITNQTVVICEKLDGLSLLNILKARRSLHPSEVFAILRPLAKALDPTLDAGIPCPDLTLHDIVLTPNALISTEITSWPQLKVRMDTLSFLQQKAFGGDATIIPRLGQLSQTLPSGKNLHAEYTELFASLVCELLGHQRNHVTRAFTPLPELTENGNAILRRALNLDTSFGSLKNFINELENAEGKQQHAKPSPAPSPSPAKDDDIVRSEIHGAPSLGSVKSSIKKPEQAEGEEQHEKNSTRNQPCQPKEMELISRSISEKVPRENRALQILEEQNVTHWSNRIPLPVQILGALALGGVFLFFFFGPDTTQNETSFPIARNERVETAPIYDTQPNSQLATTSIPSQAPNIHATVREQTYDFGKIVVDLASSGRYLRVNLVLSSNNPDIKQIAKSNEVVLRAGFF